MQATPFAITEALTHFAVVGDLLSLHHAAAHYFGLVALLAKPEGSSASVASDSDRTFAPDVQGLYRLRFGECGKTSVREVVLYAAPAIVDTHPVYRSRRGEPQGRKVLRNVFATVPLASLDLGHVTDRHPWPLVTNPTTGERHSPDWKDYGG